MHTTLAFAPTQDDLTAAYFDLPAQPSAFDLPNNPWPDAPEARPVRTGPQPAAPGPRMRGHTDLVTPPSTRRFCPVI
jgi:hypothetical protein